jgi:hypothetical protein
VAAGRTESTAGTTSRTGTCSDTSTSSGSASYVTSHASGFDARDCGTECGGSTRTGTTHASGGTCHAIRRCA